MRLRSDAIDPIDIVDRPAEDPRPKAQAQGSKPVEPRQLEIIQGEDLGRILPVEDRPITIGRVKANTLMVRDAAVSRQHAKIFHRGGVHMLADLNSSHGTFVNGRKVTRCELAEGDEIRVGETRLRYGPAGVAASPAPAATSPEATTPPPETSTPENDSAGFELEMPDELLPTVKGSDQPTAPATDNLKGNLEGSFGDRSKGSPIAKESPLANESPIADEDPFADENGNTPRSRPTAADPSSFGRPSASKNDGGGRGNLYRSSRSGAAGSTSVLQQDLDQRSILFRWFAIAAALVFTAGLGYGVMRMVGAARGEAPSTESQQVEAPTRPTRSPR